MSTYVGFKPLYKGIKSSSNDVIIPLCFGTFQQTLCKGCFSSLARKTILHLYINLSEAWKWFFHHPSRCPTKICSESQSNSSGLEKGLWIDWEAGLAAEACSHGRNIYCWYSWLEMFVIWEKEALPMYSPPNKQMRQVIWNRNGAIYIHSSQLKSCNGLYLEVFCPLFMQAPNWRGQKTTLYFCNGGMPQWASPPDSYLQPSIDHASWSIPALKESRQLKLIASLRPESIRGQFCNSKTDDLCLLYNCHIHVRQREEHFPL